MLPPDVTYAELLRAWPSLVSDIEHVDQMPPEVAQTVTADFDAVYDELRERQRKMTICEALCQGGDGF